MNIFGALEAQKHQHADALADISADARTQFEHVSNVITMMMAAELMNLEARRNALRSQWELMDKNEEEAYQSRDRVLKELLQEAVDKHGQFDKRLTDLRNLILSGDFKPATPTRERNPLAIDPAVWHSKDADLELLPNPLKLGEITGGVDGPTAGN